MANIYFAISLLFTVCFLPTHGKEVLRRLLADGKDLADGKYRNSSSACSLSAHVCTCCCFLPCIGVCLCLLLFQSGPAQLCLGLPMDSSILSWNVRGLNNPARRRVFAGVVRDHQCKLVCLQETKLDLITNNIIAKTLGSPFVDNYVTLPAAETRGHPHCTLL